MEETRAMSTSDESTQATGAAGCVYFAYGSNLDRARLAERVGHVHGGMVARLDGHRFTYGKLSRIDGLGRADVVPDDAACVWGVAYHLEADGLDRLDRFEKGYARKRVCVVSREDGRVIEAITYVALAPVEGLAPPDAYREIIRRGAASWGLDAAYIARTIG